MLQQVIGKFELTRLLPGEDNIDAVAEEWCEKLIEQKRGKIGSLDEQHRQMDFKELSQAARGRIKIVELQCAADLQKKLEGKFGSAQESVRVRILRYFLERHKFRLRHRHPLSFQ